MELEGFGVGQLFTMRAEYILAFAALAAPLLAAKPVQVYILMGQSNMLGEGRKADLPGLVANGTGKYPYLWDSAEAGGGWATSKNVRSVFVKGSGGAAAPATLFNNELMTAAPTIPAAVPGTTPREKDSIGPELGIGFAHGNHTPGSDDPIMVLKSCTGGRSLDWDLLPPTQAGFDYTDPASNVTYTYAGYHQSPNRWAKGTTAGAGAGGGTETCAGGTAERGAAGAAAGGGWKLLLPALLYWLRAAYGVLALPFVIFKVPVVGNGVGARGGGKLRQPRSNRTFSGSAAAQEQASTHSRSVLVVSWCVVCRCKNYYQYLFCSVQVVLCVTNCVVAARVP